MVEHCMSSNYTRELVTLLKDCEFNADQEKTRSIPKIVAGCITAAVGIVSAGWSIIFLDGVESALQKNGLLALGALLVVVAMFLSISGLSDKQFRAVNIKVQRYGNLAAAAFQTAMLLLIAASAAVLIYVMAKDGVLETDITILIPLVAVMLFLTYGIYELGSGPINIGITAIRRRFNCRRYSAVLETSAFGIVLTCFMVAMASTGESPMSLALGVLLALVSYFSFKMKILDDAFNETSKLFFSVRNSSWRFYLALTANEAAGDEKTLRAARYEMVDAYRNLLNSMHRTPVFSRRPVSFFGIYVLCQLADAREMDANKVGWIFKEGRRADRASAVLKMDDEKFALASAVLFDALGAIVTARKNRPPKKDDAKSSHDESKSESRSRDRSDLDIAIEASLINWREQRGEAQVEPELTGK